MDQIEITNCERKKCLLQVTKPNTQESLECQTGSLEKWKSTHQESDQVHRWGDSWSAEKRNPEISKRSREIDQGFCKNATVWDRTRWSWEPTIQDPVNEFKLVVFVDRTHQTQNESGRTSSFSNVHVWDVRKWTRRPDWSEIGQKAKKAEVQPAALGQRRLSLLSLHSEWVSTAKVMEWPPRRRRAASGVGVQLPTRSLPPSHTTHMVPCSHTLRTGWWNERGGPLTREKRFIVPRLPRVYWSLN